MKIEKKTVDLWVPKQIADLWAIEGVAESCGSFEWGFLDVLRAAVEGMKDEVSFAETYKTYDEYLAVLNKTKFSSHEIEDFLGWAKSDKRLEKGKQLLSKGVNKRKLNQAKAILQKCLEEEWEKGSGLYLPHGDNEKDTSPFSGLNMREYRSD